MATNAEKRGAARILEHILVGVGGSEPSLTALRHALNLARGADSRVAALIVEELRLPGGASLAEPEILERLFREAQELMQQHWDAAERAAQRIAHEYKVPIAIERRSGQVADCIVEASQEATLLVLGKQGCRSDHGGLLGSNSELVLRRTHRPVLLTPDSFEAPGDILVAYAGRPLDRVALEVGLRLARSSKLPLRVFTVERDGARCAAIWDEARRSYPELEAAAFEAATGHAAEAILERADPGTLLVMGAYGHPRLYRLVLGSVTEEVMRSARGPVLLCGE